MADCVLVAGATGGVGQLTVARLLEKGTAVRVLSRSPEKVSSMFADRVEVAIGDTRQPETLTAAMQGITHIICTTGTTAFPSSRWDFDLLIADGLSGFLEWGRIYFDREYRQGHARNSPIQVDAIGTRNLVTAAPRDLQRFVFVSSAGVERKDKPPFNLLNAFGVLDAKREGEQAVVQSGLPYTIIRPVRLIDGPFTSYDLNTLMQATTHQKLGIVMAAEDRLNGQTSRIDVAAACVECLSHPATVDKVFELVNQGTRPAVVDWSSLFAQA
jgi:uncharacterized protein YbjT (DUF2867 family)